MSQAKKIICGIYKITNPKGKVYIGQSTNIRVRWNSYKSKGKGKYGQAKLNNSFNKYGKENHKFEIIHECLVSELNEMERYYQDLYSCIGKGGLNCVLTESSDRSGYFSEETRKKISEAQKGRICSKESSEKKRIAMLGRKMPREGVLKSVASRKGFKHSEKTKARLREVGFSELAKQKSAEASRNRIMTPEHKYKLLISRKGKISPLTEETKRKISDSLSTLVINIENGIFYTSIKEAASAINMKSGYLTKRLNGLIKTNNTYIRYA